MTKKSKLLIVSAFVLAFILVGFFVFSLFSFEQSDLQPDYGGGLITVAVDENGNEVAPGESIPFPKRLVFLSKQSGSGDSVARLGSSESGKIYEDFTLVATVLPETATDKSVTWSVSWKESDGWARAHSVDDYMTVTPVSDGATSAVVQCAMGFERQIVITVASNYNPNVTASCICDCAVRVEPSFKFIHNEIHWNNLETLTWLVGEGYTWDMFNTDNHIPANNQTSYWGCASSIERGTIAFDEIHPKISAILSPTFSNLNATELEHGIVSETLSFSSEYSPLDSNGNFVILDNVDLTETASGDLDTLSFDRSMLEYFCPQVRRITTSSDDTYVGADCWFYLPDFNGVRFFDLVVTITTDYYTDVYETSLYFNFDTTVPVQSLSLTESLVM